MQNLGGRYIVPKYARFSNMPPQCRAVCRSTLQKSCSLYKTVAQISSGYQEHPFQRQNRCNVAIKRESERIVNDINQPNQIFLIKPNTSHGYTVFIRLNAAMFIKFLGSSSTSLNGSHNWLSKQQKRSHNNAPIPENKKQYCFSRPLKLEVYVRYWTTQFLAFPMRRLFEGGVYFEITFFESLTTVIVNCL